MKIVQVPIELIPKTDKMDAYMNKMKTINVGAGTVTSVDKKGQEEKNVQGGVTKSLTALKNPLAGAFAGALLGGFLGSALFKIIDGISSGFDTLLTFIGIVAKLLGLMVMPFVNLLIPLLIPLLYILTPFVKMLNMMLIPLMQAMMKFFAPETLTGGSEKKSENQTDGGTGEDIPDFENQTSRNILLINNIFNGLGEGLQTMIDTSTKLFEGGFPNITQAVDMFVQSFINLFSAVIKILAFPLAAIMLMLAGVLTFVANAKGTLIEQILNFGILIADMLEAVKNYLSSIVMDFFAFFANFVGGLVSIINPEWGKTIQEFILQIGIFSVNFMDFISKFLQLLVTLITSLTASILQMIETLKQIINSMIQEAINKVGDFISNAVKSLIGDGGEEGSSKSPSGDFIMKPNGQVLNFSPYDTIMGFQNTSSGIGAMVGGNTNSSQQITINNVFNGDVVGDQGIKKILDDYERKTRNNLMSRGVGIGL